MAKEKREFVPRTPAVSRGIGVDGRYSLDCVLSNVLGEKNTDRDYGVALNGAIYVYVEKIAFTPLDDPKFPSLRDNLKDLVIAYEYRFELGDGSHHDEHIRSMKIISELLLEELTKKKCSVKFNDKARELINGKLLEGWEKMQFKMPFDLH